MNPSEGIISMGTIEFGLECPYYPWPHDGSFDPSSIRRGRQVFRQDCSSCHTALLSRTRDLTKQNTYATSAEIEVADWPSDRNKQPAKFANAGAYTPDLSLITKANNNNGQSYMFGLPAGFRDIPNGVTIREGPYSNPYLSGGPYSNPYLSGGAMTVPKML